MSTNVQYIPIRVTSNVLLYIGAGIYASVAGALKELVSNAFDADATSVVVSTGYPSFKEIRVVDNGHGMSAERFEEAMTYIGTSLKGTIHEERITQKLRRPIIGRLGIGLMALSQVCDKAIIESEMAGSDKKFVAQIDFAQFRKNMSSEVGLDVLANEDIELLKSLIATPSIPDEEKRRYAVNLRIAEKAKELQNKRSDSDDIKEHLGYCLLVDDLPSPNERHGTTVRLQNILPGIQSLMQDENRPTDPIPKNFRDRDLDWDMYREEVNQWSWRELCDRLQQSVNGLNFQSLPQYHQFLWELSIMTPVPYFEDAPVIIAPKLIAQKKSEIEKFDFSLIVDNRSLHKPTLLPSGKLSQQIDDLNDGFDYNLQLLSFDDEVDGESLRYTGYIFWQRNQIQPSSVRGIQLYIRNVGIGLYDRSLLNYAVVNASSRAGQISGEIYVDKGLERALNVDRNSFRETDAHYLSLQRQVWEALGSGSRGDGIVGKSITAYYKRNDEKQKNDEKAHSERLMKLVKSEISGDIVVGFSNTADNMPYEEVKNGLVFNLNSPQWAKNRSERFVHQQVLVAVKAAVMAGASSSDILSMLEDLLLTKPRKN